MVTKPKNPSVSVAKKKYFWYPPMHLLKYPQWWSWPSMHASHSLQCTIRLWTYAQQCSHRTLPSLSLNYFYVIYDGFLMPGFTSWAKSRLTFPISMMPMDPSMISSADIDFCYGCAYSYLWIFTINSSSAARAMVSTHPRHAKLWHHPSFFNRNGTPCPE